MVVDELTKSDERVSRGPYNRFIYGLRAPESKRQYPKRLEVFLDYIGIKRYSLEERLYNFYHRAKSDTE
jgi:hypothetical protein